ncbi:MAG: hypothetical protein ABJ092_13435 [Gillisia sp.]
MDLKRTGDLVSLPGIYFSLLKNVLKQKKFIRRNILKELEAFREPSNGITEVDLKKITSYYALGVPAILGESLAVLRGKPLKERERYCLTYLGGISGLLDDLFDDPLKKVDHLEEFILHPENLVPLNKHEQLLLHMYLKGLSYSTHPGKLKAQAFKVFKAQQKSIQQREDTLSPEVIEELTRHKGGTSFNFYRLCMEDQPSPQEEEMLFHLGGLMQLGNDIFDVWEDHREGITTVPVQSISIPELRNVFEQELQLFYDLTWKIPFSPKQISQFLKITTLALARVFVCLDQFEALERSSGNRFRLENYSRKQLICDMQKPAYQLKAIKYYLKKSTELRY